MIQSQIFFAAKCDCCGDLYDDGDSTFYSGESLAVEYALENGWVRHDGGHVCPDCYEIGDDDEIELNKPFIKPEIEKPKTDLDRFKELFDSVGIPLEKDESINSFFVDQESSGDTVKTRSGAYARIDFDKDDKFEVFNVFDY